jgi:hypothetical protein
MSTYLTVCLSFVESQHPNSGILLLGDFNGLNVANLKSSFKLRQIVKFLTRGQNTLDFILTNLQDFYNNPDNIMIAGIPFVLAGQLKTNTPHYIHFF